MSRQFVFILLIAAIIGYSEVSTKPVSIGELLQCYERECPSRTVGCKKSIKTSSDKISLVTKISCLDAQDMDLKSYNLVEDNPYGPHTHYESTSFAGTYTFTSTGSDPVNININNRLDGGYLSGNALEDFS